MTHIDPDSPVRLDLNNPVFQENLLTLQKPERHAALDTLNKLRRMTWSQTYRDNGLKWEKVVSAKLPAGVDAIYSLLIAHYPVSSRHSLSGGRFYPAIDCRA